MRPAMFSILPRTHAFRCRRPGPAPVYLASQPTVTGTVNTDRNIYLDCALRLARLNDDCRPHPTTVATAPHYPHTRPPDVPARLVYQRILVNTYRTSDLCRPRGRARPPSVAQGPPPASVRVGPIGNGSLRQARFCPHLQWCRRRPSWFWTRPQRHV